MLKERFLAIGEYAGAGLYEEPHRSLFYRKSLGLRRYYENAPIPAWHGEKLYPCGVLPVDTAVRPSYQNGLELHLELISQKDPLLASRLPRISEHPCPHPLGTGAQQLPSCAGYPGGRVQGRGARHPYATG